jgi:tungstate transport system ATP-binding protein
MSIKVETSGLTKSLGGRTVLDDISCEFPAGGISVVIGPNGSGKTTLLRVAAGLETPDGGRLSYMDGDGEIPPGLPLMRRMTYVSQDPLLFSTSLYDNIAYGLRQRALSLKEVARRVDEALDLSGIKRLSQAPAKTLSGGEAQRAAIVRAYALRPELILLDEPASNLDPEGGAWMERLVLQMKDEWGASVALVTHNMFQARRLADRVFFLYGGRLVESGPRDRFFESPENELTRRFLAGEVVY